MEKITPIILCGGVGTRLWPMSRSQSPKQFHPIEGPGSPSFFQATIQRHRSELYTDPLVVTAAAHRAKVGSQLDELQCAATVISEPVSRNTGPAVLAAALTLAATDPEALMLVLPSDHIITGDFDSTIRQVTRSAEDGRIVLFGITPEYPETGYGYIVDGGAFSNFPGLHNVAKFLEKPALAVAESFIATSSAYWASGISLFSAQTIIEEFERLDPASLRAVRDSMEHRVEFEGDVYLGADSFRRATNEPTERIIFERSSKVALAPTTISWSDVGSWTSAHGIGKPDEQGNVLQGDVIATDTENALVRAESRLVAVVGVPEVIVIDTPDALLVTRRGRCQDVKKVVESLKAEERIEAKRHRNREHSWGESRNIHRSNDYEMSVLKINPGTSISLDPLAGRRLIAVQGAIELFDGLQRRKMNPGDDASLDERSANRVFNTSDNPAEALLLTFSGAYTAGAERITGHAI